MEHGARGMLTIRRMAERQSRAAGEHGADLNRYYFPSWVRRGAPTAVSGRGGLFVSFLKKRCPASGTPFYSEQVIYYPDITCLKIAVR